MMKKKLIMSLMVFAMSFIIMGLLPQNIVKAAEDTATAYTFVLTRFPEKTIYSSGEELDFSDMILTGYFSDGTQRVITDYQLDGYDSSKLGDQQVKISYRNMPTNITINVRVYLAKITNITVKALNSTSITLSWDAVAGASRYEVYRLAETGGGFEFINSSVTNSILLDNKSGVFHIYMIRVVGQLDGSDYFGEFSMPYIADTSLPGAVTGLKASGTTAASITLAWDEVPGATGYLISRAPASSGSFKVIGNADTATFTDKTVASSTGYRYKVCAYKNDKATTGEFSSEINTSTSPAQPALKYKAGDQRVRFTWNKITGATSYAIYMGDDIKGYTQQTVIKGNASTTCVIEGLITGRTYTFYVVARREYMGVVYDSAPSEKQQIFVREVAATSTAPKLFADQAAFEASSAYKTMEFFRNNVDFSRSIVIPGLITTNVGGFTSTKMCPQGITFAEDYLLLTAYDMASEENSVIYVMDKVTGNLLTTLVLPVKAHAGGIGYDGTHLWVAVGTKVSAVMFKDIQAAVNAGKAYSNISFYTTCELGLTASYLTYYDNKLWVGSYDELKETKMNSYVIQEEAASIALTKADTINMPTRVQGIAFTEDGYLILSRSCQLYQGLRGYMRQLDVYRPLYSEKQQDIIPLGDLVNTVEMPSMNEEIALEDGYLYVNFESGAFANASYPVDRICAFDINTILTKPVIAE